MNPVLVPRRTVDYSLIGHHVPQFFLRIVTPSGIEIHIDALGHDNICPHFVALKLNVTIGGGSSSNPAVATFAIKGIRLKAEEIV